MLALTDAESADSPHLPDLIRAQKIKAVLAEKGYDSDSNRAEIRATEACIPLRSNRKDPVPYDQHLYKERNVVERFFGWITQYRRVAMQYDKKAASCLGFVWVASIAIRLA